MEGSAIRSGEPSAQTAALLDLAPDAIFARDADRHITFWNRGAESTYGYSVAEALGVRPAELLKTEYPIPLEEIERIVTDTGGWEGDLVQHTKEGHSLVVESRWAAQYDEAGRLTGLLEVNRDITARIAAALERERLEAEAERERLLNRLHHAERLESLGQLAGGIAHDFNNLLAVIINYAAFVSEDLDRGGPTEEGRQALRADVEQISLAAEKAAHLTHQLLMFARREVVQPEVIDVNDVVSNIEQLLRRTLGEHIELHSSLAPDLSPVIIDPGQLEQILVNLAVNARDAMPDGGTLRIDTANVDVDERYAHSRPDISPGAHIRVRVSDTGVGMSSETVRRAFDPFFTTKPSGQGTGAHRRGGRCLRRPHERPCVSLGAAGQVSSGADAGGERQALRAGASRCLLRRPARDRGDPPRLRRLSAHSRGLNAPVVDRPELRGLPAAYYRLGCGLLPSH